MKNKPVKPRRISRKRSFSVGYDSIQSIIDRLPAGMDLSAVTIEYEKEVYGDDYTAVAKYTEHESEEAYAARLRAYEKDLLEYKEWYKKNRKAIMADKNADSLRQQEINRLKARLAELQE